MTYAGTFMTFEYEKTAPVRWPQRRHTLVCYWYELANPAFQQERWVKRGEEDRSCVMHGFGFVISFFFDDTELAEDPEGTIGDILLDEFEVSAVRRVGKALDRVLKKVDPDKSDLEYISSSSWREAVLAARKAYRLLRPRVFAEGDNLLPPDLELSK